jgi:hypothetical protein
VVGLCISVTLLIVEELIGFDESLYITLIEPLNKVSLWVWPSSIMLMAANGWNWHSVLILVLSIVANMVLYWLIGFLVGLLLKRFSLPRGNAL